ncbi:MAG TPA: YqgE/AlgH family protein [Verrucomicrobiae bacterium]|jgi:putative AlgH/UPF0301 family transcriptional regulator|nr:YqgE/AlgH family protein [Verrucomicrobiae bacterium]
MSQRKLAIITILVIISFFCAGRLFLSFDVDKSVSYGDRRTPSFVGSRIVPADGEIAPASFLPTQSKNSDELGLGKLLVASRGLADPAFAKTVVLLVQYDAHGVVGLMINRRTNVPLSRVFNQLKAAKNISDPVYAGGPVDMPIVFALLRSPSNIEGAQPVVGGIYLISAKSQFEHILSKRPDPATFHVYLGYAGWTPDQLRQEVKLGAWFIFPGDAKTVFNANPDSLWSEMIRQTELKMAKGGLAHLQRVAATPTGFF